MRWRIQRGFLNGKRVDSLPKISMYTDAAVKAMETGIAYRFRK